MARLAVCAAVALALVLVTCAPVAEAGLSFQVRRDSAKVRASCQARATYGCAVRSTAGLPLWWLWPPLRSQRECVVVCVGCRRNRLRARAPRARAAAVPPLTSCVVHCLRAPAPFAHSTLHRGGRWLTSASCKYLTALTFMARSACSRKPLCAYRLAPRARSLQLTPGHRSGLPARYFYVDVYLGTPPQRGTVIVDTGSTLLALPCTGYVPSRPRRRRVRSDYRSRAMCAQLCSGRCRVPSAC